MNTSQALRFGALVIGGFLLLDAVSDVVYVLSLRNNYGYSAILALPVIIALASAAIIYFYASKTGSDKLQLDSEQLLSAGLKLLGVYLVVFAITPLFANLVVLSTDFFDDSEVVSIASRLTNLAVAVIKLGVGIVLMKRTQSLIRWLQNDA